VRWREQDGVRWLEADLPGGGGVRAAFSTRLGGVSEGPFESLNLGRLTGDLADAVGENRRRLAAAVGVDPQRVLIGRQVHGSEVVRHARPAEHGLYGHPTSDLPEADGQATAERHVAPLVFVADCLPVALAGPRGVAMIHCGWRGMAAGIVARGAGEVEARAAVVGPGIGPCCYQVGDEVLAAFERLVPDVADGRMLDLRLVARRLLERAGVEKVEVCEECTSCRPELFFSHRRDGERTGRQAGLVWTEPAGNGGEAEASGGVIPGAEAGE
jgi:YfiH family protein